MSQYLVNPSGITVEIDDVELHEKLVKTPGFRAATDEEKKALLLQKDQDDDSLYSIYYVAPAPNHDGYGQSHEHLRKALLKFNISLDRDHTGQKIGIALGYPEAINSLKTPIKILYTMFESTKIPPEWVDDMKKADLVLTASSFCQGAFHKFGIKSDVVPMGYDENTFKYAPKDITKSKFTFLHYTAFNYRKGWDLVFKAFNQEFSKTEPVELILKSTKSSPIPILKSQYPNIITIARPLPHRELHDLLVNSDAFVLPSRGEGFGHPPLEALATGTPTIIPDAHGFSEYFDPEYFFEVEIEKKEPAAYERYKGRDMGKMFTSSVKSLRSQMRFVYENKEYAFKKARNGSIWASNNWTYAKTAEKLVSHIEKLDTIEKDVSSHVAGSRPKHSIIMLTYNALSYTKKAIQAVKDYSDNYELIVVDNNSTDDTQRWLKKQSCINHLVINKENKGVAGGRNQGLELASGDIVTYLDNDTEVKPGWQDEVFRLFDKPKVGVVGCGGQTVAFLKPVIFKTPPNDDGVADCDVVPGYCFSFKRELLGYIGNNFDDFPNSKFWHEDLDFCLRAKMAGFRVLTSVHIPVAHHEHKSMGENVSNEDSVELVDGWYENAAFIQERLVSTNTVNFYRDFRGFDKMSSYDVLADNLGRELRKLGLVVVRKDSIHSNPASFDLCKGFDILHQGKRIILLHLENDRPPKNWQGAMQHVDYALAASPHVVGACSGEPYADKIYDVSSAGIDSELFNFDVRPLDDFYPDKFKFMMVGATQPRKNTRKLIELFVNTFDENDDVVLILKDGGYGQTSDTQRFLSSELSKKTNPPQVELISDYWTPQHLARVYKTVAQNGAYIHPHRAEAFGLPIIEALACGCRVGTTNWGGPKYTTKGIETVTHFDFKLEDSLFHNHPGEPYYDQREPRWAKPKSEDIAKFMTDVIQQEYDPKKAKKASKKITKQYSFEQRAKEIRDFLCKI